MTSRNNPYCHECGRQPREGRSLLCPDCRAAHRRARKTETQRSRRAASREDPEITALLEDLRPLTQRLGEHLARQQQQAQETGKELNRVQSDALRLTQQCVVLIAHVEQRGPRRPR